MDKICIDSIIHAFGSQTKLAKALGHKNVTTVNGWKKSGKIPYWRKHEILAAAESAGVALNEQPPST